MIDRDELDAWLWLLEAPGIGRTAARQLLLAFGTPDGVRSAGPRALADVVDRKRVNALCAPRDHGPDQVAATWAWLNGAEPGGPDRQVLPLGEVAYPARLLESHDPPLLLYLQGRAELLSLDSVAVVGSRNPTRQGAENAQAFARALSEAGLAVVSGLALGIDGAAHTGALDAGGVTVAVVGTGLDRVYPARHLELAHRIAATGVVLSEHPIGTPPLPANFPVRNRIIAGLTLGTLVVEATLQSGSLITARLAAEAGREVCAIPGSIHAPQSRGCHALIRQGAKLVECAADVLEELRPLRQCPPPSLPGDVTMPPSPDTAPPVRSADDPLLDALGHDPTGLDVLIARTGRSAQDLSARLLELELQGRVARLPGQLFQRIGLA